jgi:hypothetical protein
MSGRGGDGGNGGSGDSGGSGGPFGLGRILCVIPNNGTPGADGAAR